jgi:hypothetical protein
MPDLVRRAATAVEALRPHYFERRRRLVPELAQLVGRQLSQINPRRLAVTALSAPITSPCSKM